MSYNYNIEKSIVDTGLPTTYRSLDPNSPLNQQLTEADVLAAKSAMLNLLKEVQIRFDNDPKFLTKRDFGKLIELLQSSFGWLYSVPQFKQIIDDWEDLIKNDPTLEDQEIQLPSAQLVYESIKEMGSYIDLYVNNIHANTNEVNEWYNMFVSSSKLPYWDGEHNTRFTFNGNPKLVEVETDKYGILLTDADDSITWYQLGNFAWEYNIEVLDNGLHLSDSKITIDGVSYTAKDGVVKVELNPGQHTIRCGEYECIVTKIWSNATNYEIYVQDPLILYRDPELDMEAATKQYVDNCVSNYSPEAGRNIQIDKNQGEDGKDYIHALGYKWDNNKKSFAIDEQGSNGNIASGNYSFAEGYGTYASGQGSSSQGYNTSASGQYSHAEGESTTASGQGSHSEGKSTTASGNYSHASGESTTASGKSAFTTGYANIASGEHSFAGGKSSTASNKQSFAFGNQVESSKSYSVAFGSKTVSSGESSFATGIEAQATNKASFTQGNKTIASGKQAAAFGNQSEASGESSFAIGIETHAEGKGSFASGDGSYAGEDYSIAVGQETNAEGEASFAGGVESTASGKASFAFGKETYASSNYAVAFGQESSADRDAAFATGMGTTAAGKASFTAGNKTHANANYSFAAGNETHTNGEYSATFGDDTYANSNGSFAQGKDSVANASYSHAEGMNSATYGEGAHAEGKGSIANGNYSHAEGRSTVTYGEASHAEGNGTTANGSYSHAEGGNTDNHNIYIWVPAKLLKVQCCHWYDFHITGGLDYRTKDRDTINLFVYDKHTLNSIDEGTKVRIQNKEFTISSIGGDTSDFDDWTSYGYSYSYSYFGSYSTPSSCYYALEDIWFKESASSIPVDMVIDVEVLVPATSSALGVYGNYSHGEGLNYYIDSTSKASHAEGELTQILGATGAHAEGYKTSVQADYAHAEGIETQALAVGSSTSGYGTVASDSYQAVIGKFNTPDEAAFIVGCGENDLTRANAFVVHWDGRVSAGADPVEDMDLVTLNRLEEVEQITAAALNDLNQRLLDVINEEYINSLFV